MKTLKVAGWVCAVALAVLLWASPAWSQGTSLSGTIVDPTGASVPGAEVTLTNEATGATRTVKTESDGKYLFTQLAPGKYKLEVKAQGFKTAVSEHLEVLVGITTEFDVRLAVGTLAETMVVEATVVGVNTTDASIGNPISGAELQSLPVLDMNPAGLLGLQAGVAFIPVAGENPSSYGSAPDFDGRSGSVNGARSDQTNVTLDGVDVNDPQKGFAFTSVLRVPQGSLAEFRTTTTNYNAEGGGRSSAAQVQLVTKSGTNDLHGSVYYSHRNEALNANDFFLNRAGEKEPKFRHHLYGVALGGPIIKDRFFLFGNWERLTESLFKSAERDVPSVAFRDGVFFYECDTSDPLCVPPAGGFVAGVSGTRYGLDGSSRPCRQNSAGCGPIPSPFFALSPAQISAIDPLGLGPNPAILAHMAGFPDPNSTGSFDGLNIPGFRFAAPVENRFNTGVVRADFHIDRANNHILFWRGTLQHDTVQSEPQFPGQPPRQTLLNNNKGFGVGYTAILTPQVVNNFRYGLTRISDKTSGLQTGEFVDFRFISNLEEFDSNSLGRILPQHHFRDDISWAKGRHGLTFGGEARFTRNSKFTTANSFHTFLINPSWLPNGSREIEPGQSACAQAGCTAVPENASGRAFRDALTQMLGPISQVDAFYNFDRTGSLQPPGEPVPRKFAVNEYELYFQDQWRALPSLTLTLGARYLLISPPWEVNGNQIIPTPSLSDWFRCRDSSRLAGLPTSSCGLITTDLGGRSNDRPGYYSWDYNNWSPRLAIAWSPHYKNGLLGKLFGDGKLSIRGGYSLVYDRIGNGIATTFDEVGSFGLSTNVTSFFGGCGIGFEGTQSQGPCVRFSGLNATSPAKLQSLEPSPCAGFPCTPPAGLLTVTSSLDDGIRTPYAHTFNLSIARELPWDFTVEAAYVGRRGRNLLLIRDYAMPADLVDPASGISGFEAARGLIAYAAQHSGDPDFGFSSLGPIPYWENLFPGFGPGGANNGGFGGGGCLGADALDLFPDGPNGEADTVCTSSATQVAYDYLVLFYHGFGTSSGFGASTFWQDVDYFGFPGYMNCAGGSDLNGDGFGDCPNAFFPAQYVNLHTWTTIARSEYHAFQLMLRKRMSRGVSFAFNYTLSKSLDHSSTPERQEIVGGFFTGGYTGTTINAWDVEQEYSLSDFDMRHQINSYWIWDLPFGRGRAFRSDAPGWLNQIIGGWQISGIFRINSGLPANIINGRTWPTNWDLQGNATCAPVGAYPFGLDRGSCPSTQNVHGATHGGGGQPTPNLFADPDEALEHFRFTEVGRRGERNIFRADKYFSTDLGITKSFNMPLEGHKLAFRWEIFNLTNSVYFDAASLSASIEDPGTFGDYSAIMGKPRQMQVSLRYEF